VSELAKKSAEEDKGASIHVPLSVVRTIHKWFKADLLVVHGALDDKITDLQINQQTIQSKILALLVPPTCTNGRRSGST